MPSLPWQSVRGLAATGAFHHHRSGAFDNHRRCNGPWMLPWHPRQTRRSDHQNCRDALKKSYGIAEAPHAGYSRQGTVRRAWSRRGDCAPTFPLQMRVVRQSRCESCRLTAPLDHFRIGGRLAGSCATASPESAAEQASGSTTCGTPCGCDLKWPSARGHGMASSSTLGAMHS
jgi:hypothetical protein